MTTQIADHRVIERMAEGGDDELCRAVPEPVADVLRAGIDHDPAGRPADVADGAGAIDRAGVAR